jgi:O-antigen/teichoic acid export membrane protein
MNPGSLLERAAQSAYYTVVSRALFQLLSLLATVLLVRVLSRQEYGAYGLIVAAIPLLQLVGSLGLLNVLQRYLPQFLHTGAYSAAARLVRQLCVARLLTTTVIIAAVVAGWDSLAPLVKLTPYRDYVLLFSIAIVAFQQWGMLKAAIEASFGHRQTMALLVASAAIRVVGYAFAGRADDPLMAVLLVDCAAFAFLAASHLLVFVRTMRRYPPDRAEAPRPRMLRYAAFSHFNDAGVQLLDTGIDNVLLAYFMDLPSVAIYAFCDDISRKLSRLSPVSYLGEVIRPAIFARGEVLDRQRLSNALNVVIRLDYAYFVPVFFAVAFMGADAVRLVFGKYDEHAHVLTAVVGFAALNQLAFSVGLVAQLRERVEVLVLSKVFGIYNFVASLLLIPRWGVMGAAIATGSAGLLKNLFVWWCLRAEFSLARPLRSVAGCLLYWASASAGLLALAEALGLGQRLAIGVPAFIVLFVVYLRYVYRASPEELQILGIAARSSRLLGLVHAWYSRRSGRAVS